MKEHTLSASRLKEQNFPIDVRFAGGWRTVHYVSADKLRGDDIVILWDRDGQEIAKLHPYSQVAYRED